MKRLFFMALAFSLLVIGGVFWFVNGMSPLNEDKTVKRFVVSQGETASKIGEDLVKNGFLKDALVFRIYTQVTQSAKRIRAGSYELSSNLWMPQIIAKLLEGPNEVWVTIPEGFRREEIANRFIENLQLTETEAETFYDQFLSMTLSKEGYLFPDTYLVPKDVKVFDVVKLMEDNFKKRVDFSVNDSTIILASIIERETRSAEERPVVAGILLKRISSGWPLQADATVQYAKGNWNPVSVNDLQVDSPYNTYLNLGLPPTPICNPGLLSIKAVTHPTQSDYWYYIHDKDGQIHYAKTIEEQNVNIAKYLQ